MFPLWGEPAEVALAVKMRIEPFCWLHGALRGRAGAGDRSNPPHQQPSSGDGKGRASRTIYGDCWEAGAVGGDRAACPSPEGVQEGILQMRGREAVLLPTRCSSWVPTLRPFLSIHGRFPRLP